MDRLAGKTALITGAGAGIGRATALRFAAEGANVVVSDINDEAARAVATEIGETSVVNHCDTSVEADVAAAIEATLKAFGSFDILVNNAGVGGGVAWDRTIAVNLSGAFYFVNAGLSKLREARGDVVMISSVSADWPDLSGPAYQASKAGMSALAAASGFEEHLNGVRFSVIKPGAVDTPLLLKRPVPPPPEVAAAMLRSEDIAEACLMMLKLPRGAHIPELTIVPTRLQALGKTAVPNPTPAPE